MSGSVPAQERTLTDLGNKQISELISANTSIDFTGAVTGTLKYVDGWTEFSSAKEEQSGNYFPVHIDDAYSGKPITCTGEKEKTAVDLDWVLLVKSQDSKFTFTCDGKEILTLTFKRANLEKKAVPVRTAARRVAKKQTT